ncbi:amino acid adenylation domain-containing protein [Pyxidicoccus fallax]|uniref:amino acid adenylation domain-containing protein n=1 Tax=Pyxidicoccus fallax TaxID=394095 RepID=UPI0031B588CA
MPDPFASTPGERLYRTGDQVRRLADGGLEYLGRLDFQVKVRGFRIELGEIEAALEQHPRVRQAVVVAREDVAGDKRLVAYVVPPSGAQAPDASALREALKQQLPEYMVPSAFVALEALPLTFNGKLDRKALPSPELQVLEKRDSYVAPRTPTEQLLASQWGQLLGLARIGARDNFFELGGHSLLATQVISRIRGTFGVDLPISALFEAPTLEALAASIDALAREGGGVKLPPLQPIDRTGALPLSFAQQRLWFLDQLVPDSALYNMPAPLRLEGSLDVAALERSLTELVRRHEVLRTSFPAEAGQPLQVISPPASMPLERVDLSALPADEREAEARRLIEAECRKPFSLARGPLLRALLLKLAETEHVLLLNLHHIISDGWSMGVLAREVVALYEAFSQGRPSPLPELPVQYADFASWQRGWLQGEALEAQFSYWSQQLAGAPQLLELPTDRPRPATQSYRGATLSRLMPQALSQALQVLCQREGVTSFMALLAGFQALLSRYSGQTDVVVGTDIAGRTHADTESLIGFFINQLVMRGDLSGDPTFRELLGRTRQATLGAYAHQDVPFEELVRVLNPERSLAHAPIFQVKLVLQNAPTTELHVPGLTFRGTEGSTGAAKFDLTLSIQETPEGLSCLADYSTDLFDAGTMARMLEHLQVVLEAAVARPDTRLSSLPFFTEAERQRLLVDWNGTHAELEDSCAHRLFEAQVRRTPDATALQMGATSLTYRQLDERANQLAWHLRSLGVGPEVLVGLCVERSPELVVSILAVLKAGGAWLPLDSSYPTERLSFMLRDARPPVLLTHEKLADELPVQNELLVLLDSEWDSLISRQPTHAPDVRVLPDNLAYVIYTSGSTGRPKGTLLRHRGLCNTARETVTFMDLGPGRRLLQFFSSAFDASVSEIFPALLSGACLVLASRDELMPGEPLLELVSRHSITTLKLTPSVLAQLEPEGLRGIQTLITAGEACPPELVARFQPGRRFVNAYGPTEATVCATVNTDVDSQRVSIGKPFHNVRTYVLDALLRPVPVGVPGELFIGGLGLARGYLGRPELTAERFIPNPFASEPGERLYRTGDKARWLADGTLEYLGRIDSQVKLRGFRIELGEVESVLASHPSVREAVVSLREDGGNGAKLVAYLVAQADESLDAAALRSFAGQKLPEYMVPATFVVLPALPLTSSGKVDRKALPAPDSALSAGVEYVAPRNETERKLAALWSEVLQVEKVGIHDNFFELGGHSLLVTQISSRIRASLGVDLPLPTLFESSTIEALARAVESVTLDTAAPHLPPLRPVERTGALPLSFAQQRLWFLDQLVPDSALYNMPAPLRLEGSLDVAALERSLTELVRRHEVLRTSFPSDAGQPLQVIAPPASMPLDRVDLSALPAEEREAEARRLIEAECRKPFSLARGPLLRALLLKLADTEHVLLLNLHHIVSDGWSMGVLAREVVALYGAFSQGQPSPLPELPVQYADFASWQRGWLQGEALEAQFSYWRQQLTGAPQLLELPTDRPRPAMQSYRGALLSRLMPATLANALQALCQREGVTSFMALLSGFQALLSRYSGQTDVVVGTDIAGRTHADTEGLIGFFINQLVMRGDLSGDPTFRELLGRTRQATLGAYAHQDVPFEELVRVLNPERSLAHAPLFQVKLVLQNTPTVELRVPGLTFRGADSGASAAKFDLTLSIQEMPEGLSCVADYSTDLFDAGTMARMLEHLQVLLEAAVAQPDTRLSSLPLLTTAERQRVLVEWNDTRAQMVDTCAHHLFEAQVARSPDAPALQMGERTLTYRQLDERANQLAHHLRSLGVGPEVLVGLCVERSPELVVSILAVLKAGGAWLPLDSSYPTERLSFMLRDARPPVLLTQDKLADELPVQNELLVLLDSEWDSLISRQPTHAPDVRVLPDNLAYVIYTSGSTGRPKGTLLRHRGLCNTARETLTFMDLGPGRRLLQFFSSAFDASVSEIFPALLSGACLVLASRDELMPGEPLLKVLQQHSITTLKLTPSVLAQLEPERLQGVRTLITAGEACPPELVARFQPGRRFVNAYGPTEATVCATVNTDVDAQRVSIGKPFHNVQTYVLDSHLRPVPVGVPGELFIGGLGLARGYLGRPELTAERFIPNPFASEPGERLYRTGDKARWLADGTLEYLGRIDSQVKLRGFRIELGEIESVLASHPSVREAVVSLREDGGNGAKLVAYVVPGEEGTTDTGALRTFIGEKLPEYMVPAAFVVLPALPLTSSGKVDRKALPAPDSALSAGVEYVAPRNETEQKLAALWSEVLQVEKVGIHDNFFELGGHSLLATQAVTRIRSAFNVETSLQDFFETPTVAGFALNILRLTAQVDLAELESMMAQLDGLDDEEVQKLLASESSSTDEADPQE